MADSQAFQAVQAQIDALARFYQDYSAESSRLEHAHTGLRQIGDWFTGASRFSNDSMHTKFYEDAQARITQLDRAVSALESQEEARRAALAAIDIIFDPVEESERDVGDWMRFAAEPLCQPFLTYLDRDSLRGLYERYNQIYPKRLQFPNQVKLRKAMEALLKSKR